MRVPAVVTSPTLLKVSRGVAFRRPSDRSWLMRIQVGLVELSASATTLNSLVALATQRRCSISCGIVFSGCLAFGGCCAARVASSVERELSA